MPDNQSDPDLAARPCPECGGDTTELRARPIGWTRRAVLVPTLIWLVLLIGFLVYTTPGVQTILGNPEAFHSQQIEMAPDQVEVLRPALRAGLIFDHPQQAATQLMEGVDTLAIRGWRWSRDGEYRFAFVQEGGGATHNYGIGPITPWFEHESWTMLRRLNQDATGTYAFDYPPESIHPGIFNFEDEITPELFTVQKEVRLNGSQLQTRTIRIMNYVELMVVTTVFMLLAFRVFAILGLPVPTRRTSKRMMVLIVLLALTGLGSLYRVDHHHIMTGIHADHPDQLMSEWIDEERMANFITDEAGPQALLELIKTTAITSPPDAVLAIQSALDHGILLTQHTSLYTGSQRIWSYFDIAYQRELDDGTSIPANRSSKHPKGFSVWFESQLSAVNFTHGGPHSEKGIKIYWSRVVFLGWVIWLVLRLLRLIGRQLVYRTQRKRVRRGQCIFCAYPLSPEALAARSGDSGS